MQPIIIALSEEHLNAVINALADKPYRESAPVLHAINQQIEARAKRGPELLRKESGDAS